MTRLKEKYNKEVIPQMMEKFGYKNKMAVPKIKKVVVNTGIGKMISGKTSDEQKKIYDTVLEDLSLITGQKPVLTKSKKSISAFKLREGMKIGVKVTLRGQKMYDFLERLINIVLPRTRDFKGIDLKSFDKGGNLTIAIKEHISFPEISQEKLKTIFGFEISVITNAKKRDEAIELLRLMGFPLKS
ncbi:MAG TPA: 50S ribosomal protein L5 [Candidatus Pacearchaeota archaeon]|nr:50S ribosomal protein L5 [Candidatus Paceibacterota bacterium]HOK00526.1 50S ribosomal protein L5 [Candidatus Pacearchaeota archaeon]HOL90347.1 50S ribosomal protein L5 [Candidatus Pacearchaeota archaeon]